MSSPANRTRFSVLATVNLPDLNVLDGGGRASPRSNRCKPA